MVVYGSTEYFSVCSFNKADISNAFPILVREHSFLLPRGGRQTFCIDIYLQILISVPKYKSGPESGPSDVYWSDRFTRQAAAVGGVCPSFAFVPLGGIGDAEVICR